MTTLPCRLLCPPPVHLITLEVDLDLKPIYFNLSGGQAVSQSVSRFGGHWKSLEVILEVIGGH